MSKLDLQDTFVLDGVRKTADGYLTAFARVARTGIQTYRGHELGKPELDTVRVYRPPEEVFSADTMRSFAHRPLTLRHPPKPVNDKNWKQYAGGHTGEEVVRDGDCVRVPMVMMDVALIDAYEKQGIDQLSMGYSTDIQWRQGVTDAGEQYDAVQTAIRGNHLALVPVARGGDRLRVGDDDVLDAWSDAARAAALAARQHHEGKAAEMRGQGQHAQAQRHDKVAAMYRKAVNEKSESLLKRAHATARANQIHMDASSVDDGATCPECGAEMQGKTCPECNYVKDNEGELTMKTFTLDGFTVSVGDDQSQSIIQKIFDGLTARVKDADAELEKKKKKDAELDKELGDAKATISARDGEIVVLKKQIADAEVTPAKLDVMVKDRMSVIDVASTLLPKDFAVDGKTLQEIKKAAVVAKLGDAARDMDDAAIGGAFSALTAGVKVGDSRAIADAFAHRRPGGGSMHTVTNDAYADYCKGLSDAWKPANPAGNA